MASIYAKGRTRSRIRDKGRSPCDQMATLRYGRHLDVVLVELLARQILVKKLEDLWAGLKTAPKRLSNGRERNIVVGRTDAARRKNIRVRSAHPPNIVSDQIHIVPHYRHLNSIKAHLSQLLHEERPILIRHAPADHLIANDQNPSCFSPAKTDYKRCNATK